MVGTVGPADNDVHLLGLLALDGVLVVILEVVLHLSLRLVRSEPFGEVPAIAGLLVHAEQVGRHLPPQGVVKAAPNLVRDQALLAEHGEHSVPRPLVDVLARYLVLRYRAVKVVVPSAERGVREGIPSEGGLNAVRVVLNLVPFVAVGLLPLSGFEVLHALRIAHHVLDYLLRRRYLVGVRTVRAQRPPYRHQAALVLPLGAQAVQCVQKPLGIALVDVFPERLAAVGQRLHGEPALGRLGLRAVPSRRHLLSGPDHGLRLLHALRHVLLPQVVRGDVVRPVDVADKPGGKLALRAFLEVSRYLVGVRRSDGAVPGDLLPCGGGLEELLRNLVHRHVRVLDGLRKPLHDVVKLVHGHAALDHGLGVEGRRVLDAHSVILVRPDGELIADVVLLGSVLRPAAHKPLLDGLRLLLVEAGRESGVHGLGLHGRAESQVVRLAGLLYRRSPRGLGEVDAPSDGSDDCGSRADGRRDAAERRQDATEHGAYLPEVASPNRAEQVAYPACGLRYVLHAALQLLRERLVYRLAKLVGGFDLRSPGLLALLLGGSAQFLGLLLLLGDYLLDDVAYPAREAFYGLLRKLREGHGTAVRAVLVDDAAIALERFEDRVHRLDHAGEFPARNHDLREPGLHLLDGLGRPLVAFDHRVEQALRR